jgi:hypothetical protein
MNERIAGLQQHTALTEEPLRMLCECDQFEV